MIVSTEWKKEQGYFLSFYFKKISLKCQGAKVRERVRVKNVIIAETQDDLILDCCQFYSLPMSIGTPRMLKWIIIGSCLPYTNLFLTFPGLWCSCLRSSMGISRLVVVGVDFSYRLAERLLRFRSIPLSDPEPGLSSSPLYTHLFTTFFFQSMMMMMLLGVRTEIPFLLMLFVSTRPISRLAVKGIIFKIIENICRRVLWNLIFR